MKKDPKLFQSIAIRPATVRRAKIAAAHADTTLVEFASEAIDAKSASVLKKLRVADPVTV